MRYSVTATATDDYASHERIEMWSERTNAYQSALDVRCPSPEDFHGRMIRQYSGEYQLVSYWSSETHYLRTPDLVRRDPDEDYRLLIPLNGETGLVTDRSEATLRPGTGALLTIAQPCRLTQSGPHRAALLTIPAREVPGPYPAYYSFDLSKGLGRLVGAMIGVLRDERDELTGVQFDAACDRITELLRLLIEGAGQSSAAGRLADVEADIRRYVRRNIADPELSGASVAHGLGWSLRQVQLALQQAGTTPRELIREERLRLARDRLRDPRHRRVPITDIGHATGFPSASAFSAAYRRRFGETPRDTRRRALETDTA
ncbi:helix-turn-helix domain-containing protein [Actinomadura verrucosospora]|uniref:DNA-binding regulatory protein n=1 Tax=Actinomadura verrucosospora TaxID=46165 RepID=A0A7D3VWL3_ACTVE|nr:helix-turn-helix domain-containing protein [Actinomadura verrucosospora]QKG24559.1 DNA-binding regulatory protein [Actinomadura verrucosospora]